MGSEGIGIGIDPSNFLLDFDRIVIRWREAWFYPPPCAPRRSQPGYSTDPPVSSSRITHTTMAASSLLLPDGFFGDSPQTRDIAVINGRIKFVDIIFGLTTRSPDGWVAVTWSRKVAAAADAVAASSSWQLEDEHTLKACDINPSHLDSSLAKLKGNNGTPVTTLETYEVGHPTVSLHDDNTVYFMTKVCVEDDNAWVLSVDMKARRVQGVAEFTTTRTLGLYLVYSHSRISEFLHLHSGTQNNLKMPGILKLPLIEGTTSSEG